MKRSLRGIMLCAMAVLSASLLSCGDTPRRTGNPTYDARDNVPIPDVYPALRNTVGQYTAIRDTQPIPVEGYGVVADLPNTGASDFRPDLMERMRNMLYNQKVGSYVWGTQNISPDRILSSRQVALVEVRGKIPPMAVAGTHFDLEVTAVTDTQTTSLEQGVLWTTELGLIEIVGPNDSRTTTPIAEGRGQVLCLPRIEGEEKKTGEAKLQSLRTARIPNGGLVRTNMPARLQLYSPSSRTIRMIARVINTRFPAHVDHYADPVNDRIINIRFPDEYKARPQEFIDLIRHLYIGQDVPGFTERKAAELMEALNDPNAPHYDICLSLQALGRTIVTDKFRAMYLSPNPVVRFYAAWAGASLQDVQAMPVLQQIASDDSNADRQLEAIRAIVQVCRYGETFRASMILSKLVDSKNMKVRLAAYEGLVSISSPVVKTYRIPRKFDIDVVPSHGPNLIYASREGRQRIALIGSNFNLPEGALYVSPDNLLSINVLDAQTLANMTSSTADDAGKTASSNSIVMSSTHDDQQPGLIIKNEQPAEPAKKQPVQLYYRGPTGNQQILMTSSTNMAAIIATLAHVPDPRDPNYDPKKPFIGVSYQRIIETLYALCHDDMIKAQFELQPLPKAPPTAAELIEGARPEKPRATLEESQAPTSSQEHIPASLAEPQPQRAE